MRTHTHLAHFKQQNTVRCEAHGESNLKKTVHILMLGNRCEICFNKERKKMYDLYFVSQVHDYVSLHSIVVLSLANDFFSQIKSLSSYLHPLFDAS